MSRATRSPRRSPVAGRRGRERPERAPHVCHNGPVLSVTPSRRCSPHGGPGNRAGFPVSRHLSGRPDPLPCCLQLDVVAVGGHRWPWCRSPLVGSSGGGLGPVTGRPTARPQRQLRPMSILLARAASASSSSCVQVNSSPGSADARTATSTVTRGSRGPSPFTGGRTRGAGHLPSTRHRGPAARLVSLSADALDRLRSVIRIAPHLGVAIPYGACISIHGYFRWTR